MPSRSVLSTLALGALSIAAGLAGLWAAWSLSTRGAASRDWPTTDGTVVASGVEVRNYARRRSEGRVDAFLPVVRYRYTVNGGTYETDRISFSVRTAEVGEGARATAETTSTRFPVGSRVRVFYDPSDPREATLMSGPSGSVAAPLGVGAFLLLAGIALLVVAVRRWRDGG